MRTKLFAAVTAVLIVGLVSGGAFAGTDKLIVKDSAGTSNVFQVQDDGALIVTGEDGSNFFGLNVVGHTGGSTHAQIATNNANSRLTIMASTNNDSAPRIAFLGPSDPGALKGGAFFDYGSKLQNLSNAEFQIRYMTTGPVTNMIRVKADQSVRIMTDTEIGGRSLTLGGSAEAIAGSWVDGSSREYKENIRELSVQEALDALVGLSPVKYAYKTEPGDERVGFIAEDVPDLVATNERKGLSPMDIVGVLTKVVQEQQQTIQELSKKVASLEEKGR